ncbi:MAG: hypothetical protein U9M90_04965 [Patescibacteria group bacterium]|nr:hypothetical protein [Patescibacteria group bacterium]
MKAANKKRSACLFSGIVAISAAISIFQLTLCPEKNFAEQSADVYFGILLLAFVFYMPIRVTGVREIKRDHFLIKDGKVERILESPNVFWRWEFYSYKIRQFPRISRISMNAFPIAENPKVKQIKYDIYVEMEKEIAAAQAFIDSKLGERDENLVTSILYDFNEECSKELGRLFNPLNKEQQEQFFDLISGFLNPRLAKVGLNVASATFSL